MFEHYAKDIQAEITERLYNGEMSIWLGINDFTDGCVHLNYCVISQDMSLWWVNRYEFLADLEVSLNVDINTDQLQVSRNCRIYVTVAFSLEDQVIWAITEFGPDQPEHNLVQLDDYLIPILDYDGVEDASEAMLMRYLYIALQSNRPTSAIELARSMHLSVMPLRLHKTPKTKSVLYWTDSKVKVIRDDATEELSKREHEESVEGIVIPADTIVINIAAVHSVMRNLSILHECFLVYERPGRSDDIDQQLHTGSSRQHLLRTSDHGLWHR